MYYMNISLLACLLACLLRLAIWVLLHTEAANFFLVCLPLFALRSRLAMWLHQRGAQWYHMGTRTLNMFG